MLRASTLVALFISSLFTTVASAQTTRTVCASGCDFTSINAAIDASSNGDVIQLSAETYSEGSAIVLEGKQITIIGTVDGNGDPTTILDGGGAVQVLRCIDNFPFFHNGPQFENLVIQNGFAPGGEGGGMYIYSSNPTLTNCMFKNNSAYRGGGMYNYSGVLVVGEGCFGCAPHPWPTLINCTFTGNKAFYEGGGMYNTVGNPTLTNCTFTSNVAEGGGGGGMCNMDSRSPTLNNCTFTGNVADDSGGGMLNNDGGWVTLNNCTFTGNVAESGGAIWNVTYVQLGASITDLTNCTFCGNTPVDCDANGGLSGCGFGPGGYASGGGNCHSEVCDTDGDDTLDCNDNCPNDPNKTEPGECGCDVPETGDSDGDGIHDCNDEYPNDRDNDGVDDANDNCPDDASKSEPGECGCGVADIDTDNDGIFDCNDEYPNDRDNDGVDDVDDNCELPNPDQADCNGNGVGDTCEVADGLLPDCDGNGVPDGCDLQDAGADCNSNGYLDACEIANGFAEDCDGDGVIDSCQIAGEGTLDCDGNGRLDSCDLDDGAADCNSNGVLDSCDIAGGGSFDDDGNGIPDECLADAVYNQADGTYWDTLDSAMNGALEGDTLLVPESFFDALDGLELMLGDLTLQSLGGVTLDSMPDGILLGGDTTLAAAADSAIAIGSALDLLDGEASTLSGGSVTFGETAAVSIPAGSMLAVESSQALVNDGAITLLDGLLISETGTAQSATGSLTGFGTLSGAMTNAGTVTVQADLQCTDDFTNDGEVRIQSGTLTTVGTFTNNGTVLGSLDGARSGSGGAPSMTVIGDLVLGSEGSLLFGGSGTSLRVSGDLSIAATQSVQIDLSSTEVRMIGLGDEVGAVQRLELLGEDLGATEDGFDRTLGGFPIGTLRVGPMPTTVRLVDDHDNDGLGTNACEVLYVDTLQLDANTTLETNGCVLYCRELVLSGSASIDVPSNVVVISDPPNCPGDVTGDETVDGQDLAAVLAAWGQDVPDLDQNADGTIDGQDLAAVLDAWGLPCGQ